MRHGPAPTSARGIVLAAGRGKQLMPLTRACSKMLLPIFDKPLIYYPISTLMLSGIREILILTLPADRPQLERLLGDGQHWGLSISYCEQPAPKGIAEALVLGERFIDGHPSCLILGDNLFYGHGLSRTLGHALAHNTGATIFGYQVGDPTRYGVIEFGAGKTVLGIEERPALPKSQYAVAGLYIYDKRASAFARRQKRGARGSWSITDLNLRYLREGALNVEVLGRGVAWLDAGSTESVAQAASFIETIELRQGLKACCPEEIAFGNGWIGPGELLQLADDLGSCSYADYLRKVVEQPRYRA